MLRLRKSNLAGRSNDAASFDGRLSLGLSMARLLAGLKSGGGARAGCVETGRNIMNSLSVSFVFRNPIKAPINLREHHVTNALVERGHRVVWFGYRTGKDGRLGSGAEWRDLPRPPLPLGRDHQEIMLAASRIHLAGCHAVWISGWSWRSLDTLRRFVVLLRCLGKKVIYDPIDPVPEYAEARGLARNSPLFCRLAGEARRVYGKCDLILAVTEELRQMLLATGLAPERVLTAHWGPDVELFLETPLQVDLRSRHNLEGKLVIGWLGTMSPFKGIQEILLPLFRELSRSLPNVGFLVGGDGSLLSEFQTLQRELPAPLVLVQDVPYDTAPDFTRAVDVYVVPTNPNTAFGQSITPVKIFDALALGIPVLTTETAATRRLSEKFSGLHLANYTVDGYLRSMRRILADIAGIRARMAAECGLVRAYSHQVVSREIAEAVETALA